MSEPSRQSPKRRRGCLFYAVLIGIGLPLLMVLLAVLLVVGKERSARKKLNVRIAAIQAEGLPTDNDSMATYHRQLTSDRDTAAWMRVLGLVSSQEFRESQKGLPVFDASSGNIVPAPTASSDENWQQEQQTRAFLRQWSNTLEEIQALAAAQLEPTAKPVRFPLKFESINTLLENTQHLRQAARLLRLSGEVAIYDRDSTRVTENIQALFGCGEALAGEPVLVSQLVRLAIDGMGIGLLHSALEHDVLSESDLQTLLQLVLRDINVSPSWNIAHYGERAIALTIFENPAELRSSGSPQALDLLPFRSSDALHYLDMVDGMTNLPLEDLDAFATGYGKQEAEVRKLASGSLFQRLDSVMTGMLAPAISASGTAFVRNTMQHRLAAVAIGIRIFEKRHGQLPKTLQDLEEAGIFLQAGVEGSKLLPVGGKPFGYRIDGQDALLWGFSIGQHRLTPAEPPLDENGQPTSATDAIWIWRLRGNE